MKLIGRKVNAGKTEGMAMVTSVPFSFGGELDPETGVVPSRSHEFFGQRLAGKILVCPTGKGSSGGPLIAYLAQEAGNAPAAVVVGHIEPILASAILTANIPAVDQIGEDELQMIETGDYVKVDADQGTIEVIKRC